MKVISVNVGQPTAVQIGNRATVSGIRKHPVPGRVQLGSEGLEGDRVLDRRFHGGADQAVYLYTQDDYDAWAKALGQPLPPGKFGENIVVSGLESAQVQIGERLILGSTSGQVVLEVTAPRIPCGTLASVMEDTGFVKRFTQMGRPGFYARVLVPGDIGAGDSVGREPAPAGAPTIGETFALWYDKQRDLNRVRQILDYPVAERMRRDYQKWLSAGD